MAYTDPDRADFDVNDASHCAGLGSQLYNLSLDGEFTDVTLRASDGHQYRAHKLILVAASSYFKGMLQSDMTEGRTGEVDLSHFDSDVLGKVLRFIYTGQITIRQYNVMAVYEIGDHFGIKSLCVHCKIYMQEQIEPQNVLGFYMFAKLHKIKELKDLCERFMMRNLKIIADNADIEDLKIFPEDELVKYIADDKLQASSEDCVYIMLSRWIKADIDMRKERMESLAQHVRLGLCSTELLVNMVAIDEVMQSGPCQQMVSETLEQKAAGETPNVQPRYQKPKKSSLVVFGRANHGPVKSYFIFSDDKWTERSLPRPLEFYGACDLEDGRILAKERETYIILDIKNPENDIINLPKPFEHNISKLLKSDEGIYIMTLWVLYKLNLDTLKWECKCSLWGVPYGANDYSIRGGETVIVGNSLYANNIFLPKGEKKFPDKRKGIFLWRLDIETGEWQQKATLHFEAGQSFATVVATDTHLYAFKPDEKYNHLAKYDIMRNKWSKCAKTSKVNYPFPKALPPTFTAMNDGALVLTGGTVQAGNDDHYRTATTRMEIYSTHGNGWYGGKHSGKELSLPIPMMEPTVVPMDL